MEGGGGKNGGRGDKKNQINVVTGGGTGVKPM